MKLSKYCCMPLMTSLGDGLHPVRQVHLGDECIKHGAGMLRTVMAFDVPGKFARSLAYSA